MVKERIEFERQNCPNTHFNQLIESIPLPLGSFRDSLHLRNKALEKQTSFLAEIEKKTIES